MKQFFFQLILVMTAICTQAQMMEPVKFTTSLDTKDDGTGEIVFSAKIDAGWHLYSTDNGDDGPTSASFNMVKMEGVETVGPLKPKGKLTEKYDDMFGMTLRFFELNGSFVQKVRFTKPEYAIDCYLEYGCCNDEMCMPPPPVEFDYTGKGPEKAAAPVATQPTAAPYESTRTHCLAHTGFRT